jgi:hypothetical protein
MSDKVWDEVKARHEARDAPRKKMLKPYQDELEEAQKDLDFAADADISNKEAREVTRKRRAKK